MKTLIFFLFFGHCLFAQSPYQLSLQTDAVVLGISIASGTTGALLNSNLAPLTASEIYALSRNDIKPFDRGATNNYHLWAADVSNVGVYTLMASPILLITPKKIRKDWLTIGVMYAENLSLAIFLPGIVKNSVQRIRPFVYNEDAPLEKKKELDAQRSFFSGHSSVAFSSAVFFSTVFCDYYPRSRWKPVIWTGSLLLAGTVGVMRYESGNHFPTDIIVGAAVGSAIGIVIPAIHRTRLSNKISIIPIANEDFFALNVKYRF